MLAACRTRFETLDVLVNNAGIISQVPFAQLPFEEWERVVTTNLTGPFMVISKALPLLRKGSSVINIGSRGAMAGIPLRGHYTASKAGLVGLTRSLCKELGGKGIRFNVVAPGVIDTSEPEELTEEQRAAYDERYLRMMALGRFGRPDEISRRGPLPRQRPVHLRQWRDPACRRGCLRWRRSVWGPSGYC